MILMATKHSEENPTASAATAPALVEVNIFI